MSVRSLLRLSLTVLLPLALSSTVYLYLYLQFHGCAFPVPSSSSNLSSAHDASNGQNPMSEPISKITQALALFRLLVLAEPQLEADSSLPDQDDGLLPRLCKPWGDVTEQNITWNDRKGVLSSSFIRNRT